MPIKFELFDPKNDPPKSAQKVGPPSPSPRPPQMGWLGVSGRTLPSPQILKIHLIGMLRVNGKKVSSFVFLVLGATILLPAAPGRLGLQW